MMKPQPLKPTDQHTQVQALLPLHAAGALAPDQQAMVRRHLDVCTECREDAALGLQLAAADPGMPPGLDPERALARLMPLLDTAPQETRQAAAVQAAEAASAAVLAGAAAEAGTAATASATQAAHDVRDASRQAPAGPSRRPTAPRPSGPSRAAVLLDRLRGALGGGGWRNWALAAQCAVIAGMAVLWSPAASPPDYRALGSGAAAAPDVVVVFKSDTSVGQVRHLLQASGARIVGGPTVTGAYLLDVDAAQTQALLAALRADPAVQLAEPLNGAASATGGRP